MKIIVNIILVLLSFAVSADESIKKVGDNTYRWSTNEYYVNDILVYKASKTQKDKCWSEENAKLLSYVGNMVTLNIFGSQHCDGTARLNHWERISTFRVINGKVENVSLLDLFSRDVILGSLINDDYLKSKYPNNIRKNIREEILKTYDSCESVSGPSLDNFAIHHIRDDKISIRLFLKKCNSSSRALQLGLYIAPNDKLLESAKLSNKNGLLMQHLN